MTVDMKEAATEVERLWSMLDQMRGHVPTGSRADLLAPLAALLFLRWAGKFESEQEAIAAFDGAVADRATLAAARLAHDAALGAALATYHAHRAALGA